MSDDFDDLFGDGEPAEAACEVEPDSAHAEAKPAKRKRKPAASEPEAATPANLVGELSGALANANCKTADTAAAIDAEAAEKDGPLSLPRGGVVFFDIETGPERAEILEARFSFDPSKVKGYELIGQEFDPASVKTGNLKDQAKIDAKIEEKRREFEQLKADAQAAAERAQFEQYAAFVERAPLSPITGQVLAIGVGCEDWRGGFVNIWAVSDDIEEADIIDRFWDLFSEAVEKDCRLVGFNILGFDLPFMMRRSWALGVDVPRELLTDGRRWHRCLVDLMQVWACGNYQERISLDSLCKYFGNTGKTGSGADFHRLYFGTAEQRREALDYLKNDIAIMVPIAERMGVC